MKNFNLKNLDLEIEQINFNFTVCKIKDVLQVNLNNDFVFLSRTDEEISLVCLTEDAPDNTLEREDGWRAFRIKGVLDFSLIGILARISSALAAQNIGIFAVSTFNTDYIFVKAINYKRAIAALEAGGCRVV